MKKWNYYNDNDPFIGKWVKSLIKAGLVPDGEMDSRSITEVQPDEIKNFTQCHFFCGILGWSRALELSGWDADRSVWTGSCPCQSLSCAGKGLGEKDERHLWPVFFGLISELRPTTVFGEQVASKDGREWLAGVRLDLEAVGYAVGAADLPAASVGAPHKRNRLFWVGQPNDTRSFEGSQATKGTRHRDTVKPTSGGINGVGHTDSTGCKAQRILKPQQTRQIGVRSPAISILANAKSSERKPSRRTWAGRERPSNGGFWSDSTFIKCADGKARRVPGRVANAELRRCDSGQLQNGQRRSRSHPTDSETDNRSQQSVEIKPALFPLADGIPGRVGLLRGAGNAIVPQVAAEFIKAFMEI